MSKGPMTIDAHIHYAFPFTDGDLISIMDATGTDMANLVVVPHRQRLSTVPEALMAKARHPGRLYVFASLDVSVYYRYRGKVGEKMADYAKSMLKCGCDGIKIIEGKPAMRKMLPVPDWDDSVWDPFFSWCEKEQVPILWHVNDPETFWDESIAPPWAKERGWLYDSSYINNEDQYRQVLNMLEKHPRLNIIFAHFFFMSAQLDRLSGILDRFSNVMVDLTPGIEMYQNFSKNHERTVPFFYRYYDRIVYGTDIGARSVLSSGDTVSSEESLQRALVVHQFLSGRGDYKVPGDGFFLTDHDGFTMKCLGLSGTVLENILALNFKRFVGHVPDPVNRRAILRDCRRIRITLRIMRFLDKDLNADTSCLSQVETYFKKEH